MEGINIVRHQNVFNPGEFGEMRVDVIGCGAVGSPLIMILAKLGIKNIHVWDFDLIESHNIPNQLFYNEDIGKQKVDAIAEHVFRATGTQLTTHNEAVDGSQELGQVVFLVTDTMASRKEIWDKAIVNNYEVEVMFETRMGARIGKIYTINPNDLTHIKFWEGTLCSDEVAVPSECGGKTSVGPTANAIAAITSWQFIDWFVYFKEQVEKNWPEKQIFINFSPFEVGGW